MSSSEPDVDPRATDVRVDDVDLSVVLVDGRRLSVPLTWFPRLLHATAEERRNWRLVGEGQGIRWPDVDEDVSVLGLLRGASAPDAASTGDLSRERAGSPGCRQAWPAKMDREERKRRKGEVMQVFASVVLTLTG